MERRKVKLVRETVPSSLHSASLLLLLLLLLLVSRPSASIPVWEDYTAATYHNNNNYNSTTTATTSTTTASWCVQGEEIEEGACLCRPCWAGPRCQTYEDDYAPRFLFHAATAVVPENITGPVYQAWATDGDLGLTCPLGPGEWAEWGARASIRRSASQWEAKRIGREWVRVRVSGSNSEESDAGGGGEREDEWGGYVEWGDGVDWGVGGGGESKEVSGERRYARERTGGADGDEREGVEWTREWVERDSEWDVDGRRGYQNRDDWLRDAPNDEWLERDEWGYGRTPTERDKRTLTRVKRSIEGDEWLEKWQSGTDMDTRAYEWGSERDERDTTATTTATKTQEEWDGGGGGGGGGGGDADIEIDEEAPDPDWNIEWESEWGGEWGRQRAAWCPCGVVTYQLFAAPGDHRFWLHHTTGVLARNTSCPAPLTPGHTYTYKIMVQSLPKLGRIQDLQYDILDLKIYISPNDVTITPAPWT